MVPKPQWVAPFPQAQRFGMAQEGHKALRRDLEGDAVPAGSESGPLWLAREEREFGLAGVGRKHERTLGIGGPGLRAGHRSQAQGLAIPRGRFGSIRDEELDMIDAKRGEGRICHAPRSHFKS